MIRNVLLLSLLIIFACSETRELAEFDSSAWRNDPGGCKGDRVRLLSELKVRKDEMKEWNSEDIDRVLGKPDSRDLDKRNRIYYQYDIKGGENCEGDSLRIYLQIRFNAINRADELIIFE